MSPVDAENILIKVNNWRMLSFRHLNGEVVLHLFAIKILIAGPAQSRLIRNSCHTDRSPETIIDVLWFFWVLFVCSCLVYFLIQEMLFAYLFFLNQYVWFQNSKFLSPPQVPNLSRRGRRVGALLLDHIQRLQVLLGRFMQQLNSKHHEIWRKLFIWDLYGYVMFRKYLSLSNLLFSF